VSIDFLVGRDTAKDALPNGNSLQLSMFGKRVRQSREAQGMERTELARRVGVTSAYLGLIENGGKIPRMETCIKILNALNLSADMAFIDSLDAAIPQKASMLQSQIAALPPEKQRFVLDLLESMIQAIQK